MSPFADGPPSDGPPSEKAIMRMSAREMAAAVSAGVVTARALRADAMHRIAVHEDGENALNAVLYRDDTRSGDVESGALAGVPVLIKDNIATLRMPTSCGSRILADYVSPYEATAVRRLREAGAQIVGKTNMDEFAMGSSTEHSAFGPTRNPLDRSRVPGGSSGGSAAAVAAGITRVALGSETGGSVRQPAAFCGIVGIKPTYGRVSRFGLVAFASSLDHIGVFGRTVDDARLAYEVIAGPDALDSTSRDAAAADDRADDDRADDDRGDAHALRQASRGNAAQPLAGVVIGRPAEYFPPSLDAAIRERCDRALDTFRQLGAEVRDLSLAHTELAVPVYYIVAPAEASSNLSRFDGVRYGMRVDQGSVDAMYEATRSQGFGDEVTRRILLGTYVLSAGYYDAYYLRAQEVRRRITRSFTDAFASGIDVLFTPTTPTTAFSIGAVSDPYELYLSDVFTVTANLAGIPAMSQPIGRVDGLPVGGQLMAPLFGESAMLRIAAALEAALGEEAHR